MRSPLCSSDKDPTGSRDSFTKEDTCYRLSFACRLATSARLGLGRLSPDSCGCRVHMKEHRRTVCESDTFPSSALPQYELNASGFSVAIDMSNGTPRSGDGAIEPAAASVDIADGASLQTKTQDLGLLDRQRKRTLSGSDHATPVQRRKVIKVTRACDICKKRKSRCSGTLPCDTCCKRGCSADCHYDAEYRRGHFVAPIQRPTTIARMGNGTTGHNSHRDDAQEITSTVDTTSPTDPGTDTQHDGMEALLYANDSENLPEQDTVAPSRASPELDVAEIQGQYVDTSSGLAFLHRAFRKLSKNASNQTGRPLPDFVGEVDKDSPTLTVGDKPIGILKQADASLPPFQRAKELVRLYFDVCIATYRFLHLQTVEGWLQVVWQNDHDHLPIYQGLGRAKSAIVLTILAIATAHEEKATGRFQEDEVGSMSRTDSLYLVANALVEQETALPTLESAQARVVQVLFLLTTSRMNQAWYTFGTAIQLISALGLHRKASKRQLEFPKDNYITIQCRRRTFWTAYILDKYLGVIFGRPGHYNDDEMDQEMPDSVNDEDMTPSGPHRNHRRTHKDCHIDALIYHARIATIISEAAKTVYSIKSIPLQDRIASAGRLNERLQQWRASLPAHLGMIAPSSLIPTFRRQATTLKIAYSHATMHINRLFLLGRISAGSETQIHEAMLAASTVLETVDEMVTEGGTIFHAFWWSHYVTFCALAIVYAWEIQSRRARLDVVLNQVIDHSELMDLAERCHRHLAIATASNSPSRRYALILNKLQREVVRNNLATGQALNAENLPPNNHTPNTQDGGPLPSHDTVPTDRIAYPIRAIDALSPLTTTGPRYDGMNWSIQDWQSEDWLNLDSMVS